MGLCHFDRSHPTCCAQARGDSAIFALRSMSSDKGLLRRVYRGITPAIAEHALNRSILFGVGSYARKATPESWPDPFRDAVSGAGAALIKTAVLHPADTLKCRWQLGQARDEVRGLYQGFAPAALRSSLGMAIWLSSRNALERRLAPAADGPDTRPWRHFVSGAASSCMTDLCTFPLDTLKKWLQAAAPCAARGGGPAGAIDAPTVSTAARELLSAGGIRRFYSGYAPRLLIVAINGACFNSVFVATKRVLAPILGEDAG